MTTPADRQPEYTQRHWVSLVLSFAVHAVLLLLIAVVLSRSAQSPPAETLHSGQIVLTAVDENSRPEYLEPSNTESGTTVSQLPANPLGEPPPGVPGLEPTPTVLSGPGILHVPDSGQMAESTGNRSAFPFELSAADLESIQAEQRELASQLPPGPKATIQVFGSGKLTGRRFVFLIDRSASMGYQGLGALQPAGMELQSAIDSLEPCHWFQIIAYHNRTVSISRRELLPATPDNKSLVPEFMEQLVAFGSTSHQNGIYTAMAFDPDVIVILTDGGPPELNDGMIEQITRVAPKGLQIHAIQFGRGPLQQTGNFLEKLANRNNGSWSYVDLRRWNTETQGDGPN